jgi:hypothetical protein
MLLQLSPSKTLFLSYHHIVRSPITTQSVRNCGGEPKLATDAQMAKRTIRVPKARKHNITAWVR